VLLGIFVSTFARREGQVFPFIPLIIVPSVFLSGLLINIERLPGWAQVIGHGFPLFYANAVIQEVIRPEGTLGAVWGHFVILLGYSAILLALASRTLAETE
jgi:ABC-2 type transport system permease protein